MAKLLKAATALKRAQAVDKQERAWEYVVRQLDCAIKRGEFSTDVYLIPEYRDEFIDRLERYGYNVAGAFAVMSPTPSDKPGILARMFGASPPSYDPFEVVDTVVVSWYGYGAEELA